jgi:hypothetical protein
MPDRMTTATGATVAEFLDRVEPERRRNDARTLDTLFRQTTGFAPAIWGSSIVGYGQYAYRYASGHSGQSLATGFAPRKANMVIYIMPGYADFSDILARLGQHRVGKSCLYLGSLSKIDTAVLGELIGAGLRNLSTHWPVVPT